MADFIVQVKEQLRKAIDESKDEETKAFLAERLKAIEELVEPVYEKRKKGEPITFVDALNVMKITCFGNLMFCCGIEKSCVWRDLVLHVLGIGREDYNRKKILLTPLFLEMFGIKEQKFLL